MAWVYTERTQRTTDKLLLALHPCNLLRTVDQKTTGIQ